MKPHPRIEFILALGAFLGSIPRRAWFGWLYVTNRSRYDEAVFQRDLKKRKKEQGDETIPTPPQTER